MKRNLVPLLGIAFVVALAASGIFYGVFVGQLKRASKDGAARQIVVASRSLDRGTVLKAADVKLSPWAGALPPGAFQNDGKVLGKTIYSSIQENEPVTESLVSAAEATGGLGIQKGMRALSIRVIDSSGLVPFLRAGRHIDIQAVQNRGNPEANLRTILQNVEVLSVQPSEPSLTVPVVVTILTSPANADRVALADSGANIRILLRNPLDDDEVARSGMVLGSVFRDSGPPPQPLKVTTRADSPAPAATDSEMVEFSVRVGASAGLSPTGQHLQVSALPQSEAADHFWQERKLQTLASSRLTVGDGKATSFRIGKQWTTSPGGLCGLTVKLQPRVGPNRSVSLRVEPEVTLPNRPSGASTRRMISDVYLAEGQSAVVTGLTEPGETPSLAGQLFGDQARQAGELILLLTPRLGIARTVAARQ